MKAIETNTATDAMNPLTTEEIDLFKSMFMPAAQDTSVAKISNDTITCFANAIDAFSAAIKKNNEIAETLKSMRLAQREQNTVINSIQTVVEKLATAYTDSVSSVDKISAAITKNGELSRKQQYAIHGKSKKEINPLFYNTMSGESQELWKDKYKGMVSGKCLDEKVNKEDVYKELYNAMKKDGYDVEKLLAEYRNQINKSATPMDMIVNSDALRNCFEKRANISSHVRMVNNMKKQVTKSSVSKKAVTYEIANACPAEIHEIARTLSRGKRPSGKTYRNVMNILVKNGVNVDSLIKSTSKKYKLSSCSAWFAVSQRSDLVEMLREEVAKLVEEK